MNLYYQAEWANTSQIIKISEPMLLEGIVFCYYWSQPNGIFYKYIAREEMYSKKIQTMDSHFGEDYCGQIDFSDPEYEDYGYDISYEDAYRTIYDQKFKKD